VNIYDFGKLFTVNHKHNITAILPTRYM